MKGISIGNFNFGQVLFGRKEKMGSTINGVYYEGNNISVVNGVVTVDGKVVTDGKDKPEIKIQIGGGAKIENFSCDKSVTIVEGNLHGNKIDVKGSVSCNDVHGNVAAGGSVNCDDISGNVAAGGSVNCGKIGGNVSAGGSIRHS